MPKGQTKIGMVLLLGCRCRCGHEWLPRQPADKPRVCPKCKSPNWDRAKRPAGQPHQDNRGELDANVK